MQKKVDHLTKNLIRIIAETNGLSLNHTLELLQESARTNESEKKIIREFTKMMHDFQSNKIPIEKLLAHPISESLFKFFKSFPLPYCEEHIHLTGSLSPEFIWKHLEPIINSDEGPLITKKVEEVYGRKIKWEGVQTVRDLVQLNDDGDFTTYLKILFLPKIILRSKEIHIDAAYHMGKELFEKYNVGSIRLKFTLSRSTGIKSEQVPGLEGVTEEDVVLGLYEGFKKYQQENPKFSFTLTPCFRKELDFYDTVNFKSKKEHFEFQVKQILDLLKKYPELTPILNEVDTVGDEKGLYRKVHFEQLREGFRKLQYKGFQIKSHHGETWQILRKGVQSVDNAMNIWQIDTLEHGISLGINPNFYFHRIYQEILEENDQGKPIEESSIQYRELEDMSLLPLDILNKLKAGEKLTKYEKIILVKSKFHHAREVEHYQHDVLNRMINKNVSLISLPSSNLKLTGAFPDYKDHPFSWWEKKGVQLGIGTDNYITLKTNFIREMLILLFSEPENLKITKILMVATKEKRRPFLSNCLWMLNKGLED